MKRGWMAGGLWFVVTALRLVRWQIECHANLPDVIPSFVCREKRSFREREGTLSEALAGPAGSWRKKGELPDQPPSAKAKIMDRGPSPSLDAHCAP